MEYWSTRHRLNDLSDSERELNKKKLLQCLDLPRQKWDFDYFVAYRTNEADQRAGQVTTEYFSSFGEARDWWLKLSRNSFRLTDGNRLVDRISGTKQELMSALGEMRQEVGEAAF